MAKRERFLDRVKKDQFIVVCADKPEDAEQLMGVARHCSERLKKDIILLTCSLDGKVWVDRFGVPYVSLPNEKGAWKAAIDGLPTVFNAVLAIALADKKAPRHDFTNPRQLLKNFKDCKIGYLVVKAGSEEVQLEGRTWPQKAMLTLNHQRESKEKLVWASYFTRFFGSRTVVMHYNYRDATFRRRWRNNIQYLDKLFSGLNLTYDTMVLSGNELGNPDLAALKSGEWEDGHGKTNAVFIVLVADQRERDIGDLFISTPELRILRSNSMIPILFLNQRDDLYIMCD